MKLWNHFTDTQIACRLASRFFVFHCCRFCCIQSQLDWICYIPGDIEETFNDFRGENYEAQEQCTLFAACNYGNYNFWFAMCFLMRSIYQEWSAGSISRKRDIVGKKRTRTDVVAFRWNFKIHGHWPIEFVVCIGLSRNRVNTTHISSLLSTS